MDLRLQGRRALVVGGTKGIGLATSEMLVEEGAEVSVISRSGLSSNSFIRERVVEFQFDITSSTSREEFFRSVEASNACFDVVVYCVSAQSASWRASVETDIIACVEFVNGIVPLLRRESGSIVAVSSMAGFLAVPSYKSYSAVKAAFNSYFSSLSVELAEFGVRVNVVSPAEVLAEDGFWRERMKDDPDLVQRTLRSRPVKRFASPGEVASVICFLSGHPASYVSGANIVVDYAAHSFVR